MNQVGNFLKNGYALDMALCGNLMILLWLTVVLHHYLITIQFSTQYSLYLQLFLLTILFLWMQLQMDYWHWKTCIWNSITSFSNCFHWLEAIISLQLWGCLSTFTWGWREIWGVGLPGGGGVFHSLTVHVNLFTRFIANTYILLLVFFVDNALI